MLQLSNKIANSVCNQYRAENLVCPPVLCKDLFTVAAADNIDHNLSSVTAQSSFHGTAVSLIQFSSSESSLVCSALSYSLENASELVCLSSLSDNVADMCKLNVDAYVLDGAVIVQMVQPGCSKTFDEYREKIFLPYIQAILKNVNRLDIVFDVYIEHSLKSATRENVALEHEHV